MMKSSKNLSLLAVAVAGCSVMIGCAARRSMVSSPKSIRQSPPMLAGCMERLRRPHTAAAPDMSGTAAGRLAGAADAGKAVENIVEKIIVDAPPVESWPRACHGAGPFYVLVQASPYVGQFGAVADSDRADDGRGFGATVGWRTPCGASRTLGYEALIESSDHRNAHSDVRGCAVRVGFGRTWGFRPDEKLQPFVLAGAGYYMLHFEKLDPEFDISGPGGYLGGGLDHHAP